MAKKKAKKAAQRVADWEAKKAERRGEKSEELVQIDTSGYYNLDFLNERFSFLLNNLDYSLDLLDAEIESLLSVGNLAEFIPLYYTYFQSLDRLYHTYSYSTNTMVRTISSIVNIINESYQIKTNASLEIEKLGLDYEINKFLTRLDEIIIEHQKIELKLAELYKIEVGLMEKHLKLQIEDNKQNILNSSRPTPEELKQAVHIHWPVIFHEEMFNQANNLPNQMKINNLNFTYSFPTIDPVQMNLQFTNISQWRAQSEQYKNYQEILSVRNNHFNIILPEIKQFKNLYEIEKKLLTQLRQFDPDFQIFLPRLSELINETKETAEKALKFTLQKHPDLGNYNDLAQVFKPASNFSGEIDKLLETHNIGEKMKYTFEDPLQNCPNCDETLSTLIRQCTNCGDELEHCSICKRGFASNDKISKCPHCENGFHKSHLAAYIQSKGICPICKNKLNSKNL